MFRVVLRAGWYWLARWVCRLFCLLFFRFRVYGLDNIPKRGAFILVANHQSYLDPVFCGIGLRRQLWFVARDTLFANRYFGRLIRSVKTIPVRRGRADMAAIKQIIEKLKGGRGFCLFPEGTRTGDGRIAPFKGGFSLLCRRGNAVVLPVLIDGAFECWPRHQKLFTPGAVITVRYGRAISAEQAAGMDDKELAMALTSALRAMQTEIRLKKGKKPYSYL